MAKADIFDWELITEQCAEVVAKSILNGNDDIATLSQLYKKFCKKYSSSYDKLPVERTFRQKMRQRLNIDSNKVNVKSYLYKLAGMHNQMSLDMLVRNSKISYSSGATEACWIFIKVENKEDDITDISKYLNNFSRKLKEKFKDKIVFISFDNDTIVILCSNSESKEKISKYMEKYK